MNKNTIPETGLLGEKQPERSIDALRCSNSTVLSADITEKKLVWSSQRPNDWEILVYKQTDRWEVCFFRWPIHHEHVAGT